MCDGLVSLCREILKLKKEIEDRLQTDKQFTEMAATTEMQVRSVLPCTADFANFQYQEYIVKPESQPVVVVVVFAYWGINWGEGGGEVWMIRAAFFSRWRFSSIENP